MNKQNAQIHKTLALRGKTLSAFFVVGCLGYPLKAEEMSLLQLPRQPLPFSTKLTPQKYR